ncbi:MAG: MFS transporter [Acidobacteria bacterium]|nr:MFS transporter [Acidobacteriota bacterium]
MPQQPAPLSTPKHNYRLSLLLHCSFVVVGIVNTLLGPILPTLSAQWRLTDSQAGYLFVALALGAMMSAATSGYMMARFGGIRMLVMGFTLMAASLICLSQSNWAMGVPVIFMLGASLGLINPTMNLLIAEIHYQRRAAALNLVNLAWGVGAASGPMLVVRLGRDGNLSLPLFLLAALILIFALLMTRCREVVVANPASANALAPSPSRNEWTQAYVWLTAALLFCYVGTETATGGWLSSYVQRLNPATDTHWAISQSIFWAALLLGRAIAPLALRALSERRLLLGCASISLAGVSVILVSATSTGIFIGASLAGLGMSAIFPTTLAVFTQHSGTQANKMTGALFLAGSWGAAVLPWLVGQASDYYASLRSGMAVIVGGAAGVWALQIIIHRRLAPSPQPHTPTTAQD